MTQSAPITQLKGVGDEVAKKLAILGVRTIGDLITNFPRRYEDYSQISPIKDVRPGQVTLEAEINQVTGRYVRRGLHITEAIATDSTGSVRLIWFNQPYRAGGLKRNQPYFIAGEYGLRRGRFSILNPSVELVGDFPVNTARIIPIYRETKGLKSFTIRKLIRQAINEDTTLNETLPAGVVQSQKLMPYSDAVLQMHFPNSSKELAQAKKRLGFEEIFELTLAALLNKYELYRDKALAIPFHEDLARDFVSKLPFKLTDAQRRASWQVYQDMSKTQPMNRLLEGDVGSGKTLVAAMAALMVMAGRSTDSSAVQGNKEERASRRSATVSEAIDAADAAMRREAGGATGSAGRQAEPVRGSGGFQVALMAPTEILARQHADNIYKLLANVGFESHVGLLIGGLRPKQKEEARRRIAAGKIGLMVGTHALIAEKVGMHKLGLVIVDEQHRFGVEQRKKIQTKAGHMPHVLHMTATPIPRTLALTLYGELDISILDEMPPGRQPIATKIWSPNSRKQLHEKIDKEIDEGRQIFIVCPLITDSESTPGLSVEAVFERISKKDFKHRKVGMMHGRLKSAKKEAIMQKFLNHEYDILVSTTVIEVGVNVPNATVMVIEGAERFGLAQIHQLRGRVGRAGHQSYCYLVQSDSREPSSRLKALETMSDGFKLAELDLQLRGPGAIYGTMQHGALDLRVANLTDIKLIVAARNAAQEFIESGDDIKKYPHLASRVSALRAVTNLH